MPITVRVNVDHSDRCDFGQLLDDIGGQKGVFVYAAPTSYHHCREFGRYRLNTSYLNTRLPSRLIARRTLSGNPSVCSGTSFRSLVINPEGEILKCWGEVKSERSYGNTLEGRYPEIEEIADWLSWDPFRPGSECYDCRMLPTCAGGCPLYWLRGDPPHCMFYSEEEYRRFVLAMLELSPRSRVSSEQTAFVEGA